MHPTVRMLCAFVFAASFVIFSAASHAQTNAWVGPAVGNWDDPANWSLGVVPQAQSIPPDPGDVSVRIDANSSQGSSVLLQGTGTRSVGSLQIDAGDTLSIADGASLAVGPVLNSGSIRIAGPSIGLRSGGTLVNAPCGLLSLDNGRYYSSPLGQLFWNQAKTEGYGTISGLAIQNDVLIDANVLNKQLTLTGNSNSIFQNSGAMRASGGGILGFFDWGRGGILNQDNGQAGTIEAWGDSTVLFRHTAITGGRIATSTEGGVEEGQIQFSGAISLDGVELDAVASLIGNPGLDDSTFANKRTLSLHGETLFIIGVNTLSRGGVFKLSGDASLQGRFSSSNRITPRFVNFDNTVLVPQGESAVFRDNQLLIVENHGVFEANGQDAFLKLELIGPDGLPPGEAAWTNTGVIRAVNGGKVTIDSVRSNSVFENTGGMLEFDEDSSLQIYRARIRGGIVRGPTTEPTSAPHILGEATLEDVRLENIVHWQQDLSLAGNIENTGSLASLQSLTLASEEVTLTGGGELLLKRVEKSDEINVSPKLSSSFALFIFYPASVAR